MEAWDHRPNINMAKPTTDFDAVKRAHLKSDWTETKIEQLARCNADPLYFMENFMRIQHPTRGALPFTPYDFQRRMIKGMHEHRQTIVMAARQCGKTTCSTGYLLWRGMFIPDSTILVLANKYSQALEIMERVRFAYENLPNHIRAGQTEYNKGNISFDNGSRIISRATAPDAARGLSLSLLYLDEFSYVQPNKQVSFWTSVLPTLATGGDCIITSTPKNDEDIFAQLWKGAEDNLDLNGNEFPDGIGKNGFFSIKVPWWEHPDRDEEWARQNRELLGDARFAQEYACVQHHTTINIQDLSSKNFVQNIGDLYSLLALGDK